MDTITVDTTTAHEAISRYNHDFGSHVTIPASSADIKTLASALAEAPMAIYYGYPPLALELVAYLIDHNHERTLSVLGELIGVATEVASLAEYYLSHHQPSLDATALVGYYRLVAADFNRFSPFMDKAALSAVLESDATRETKYLAVLLLSRLLATGEAQTEKMVAKYVNGEVVSDFFGTIINYKFIPLIEAKRMATYANLPAITMETGDLNVEPTQLSSLVTSVCGVLVPNVGAKSESEATEPFVPTPVAVAALRHLATNIKHNKPVLVHGAAGSGKTFIVHQLAHYMGYTNNIVKIHLGEQTDSKLLLGTYTSGDQPGTFEWRAGVLTTAVTEGKWVVIEDIDKAPTEVLSVLLTLLEKRQLTIASRGDTITAANGFQLVATIRTEPGQEMPDVIGLRRWSPVEVGIPAPHELIDILVTSFDRLSRPLVAKFVRCYEAVAAIYAKPSFVSLNNGSSPRVVSFRDAVKLCKRCNHLLARRSLTADKPLPVEMYNDFFAEAVDCLASAVCEPKALKPVVSAIGECLEVPPSRIDLFLTKHIPRLHQTQDVLTVGRASLEKAPQYKRQQPQTFATTNHALRLMEQIGVAVEMVEPVLLVGETGTGKTTVVQQMAQMCNKKMTVINVSQQTEISDLLGGFKPVNAASVALPLRERFDELFKATFSESKASNQKFLTVLAKQLRASKWKNVVRLWHEAVKMANKVLTPATTEEKPAKKRKLDDNQRGQLAVEWREFDTQVTAFELQALSLDSSFVFSFVEGSLVKAVRQGEWLLLDELNLASPDTLEAIADLLSASATQRQVMLTEKGDIESVRAHPEFRLFGCMNPSTDVGKRDLPSSIRSRFSEIYVHSPDGDIDDLCSIIEKYIGRYAVGDDWIINDVAQLYLKAKDLAASNHLVDGAGQAPHFSIRTLTRTLIYVGDIVGMYGLRRSLYEGFSMSFLTLLDIKSEAILEKEIFNFTVGKMSNPKSIINQKPRNPEDGHKYVPFKHYLMRQGPNPPTEQPHYIITPYVEHNLLNLVRATSGRRFPVLVQGPTSAGKTSMIQYLASITGHKFVRINNHEHTDLQEYLGTYVSDSSGKLTFQEGVLVEALRNGHWIVLDELNLAPTDVLEALNRLLDDNRELFIPETQEVIRPHPDFMLFATQNPPGLYGGRKQLSRAFRNRFLELHFDDIPQDELETILVQRCQIAPSYGKKIVEVYRQLSVQRQSTRVFEQKNSFATLRDLFRWALREAVGYEQLAANGYMLLAERVRNPEEKAVVKSVLEKVMKVQLDIDAYYQSLENPAVVADTSVVWTKAMRRLAVLVETSIKYDEPLLLVGETGCGKTTVCQVIASVLGKNLVTVNAHQNTETGDILGAQRPVRNRKETLARLESRLLKALSAVGAETGDLDSMLNTYDKLQLEDADINEDRRLNSTIFEWSDGPLVQTLKSGDFFLLDEISLADDSVLERLNSVLEPERTLLLAEKGGNEADSTVVGAAGFEFLATMNPGGDYGKKELSPALRNRFTELWVPSMESFDDVAQIVASKLGEDVGSAVVKAIVDFAQWYALTFGHGNASSGIISLRDILAWVSFILANSDLDKGAALAHGAAMVFIDALGTNNTAFLAESGLVKEKHRCIEQLSQIWGSDLTEHYTGDVSVMVGDEKVKAGEFSVDVVPGAASKDSFNLHAPTTAKNAMRVVRAMSLTKPILLEGSPGVGKTSLITALSKATGNPLCRINLSEQTDLVDLFGSDAPGERTGEFEWRDAPFLRAMQRGEWVLLDEMNLASQSVLEGLNACLDHRGQTYIPELDKTFDCHPDFRVFAAQNPQYQGGGRKGLPKSFVNRFSVVYVDTLSQSDLELISTHLYPEVAPEVVSKMIEFVAKLEQYMENCAGGPWEFNLRDTLRWLELYSKHASISEDLTPADFFGTIFGQRFRVAGDRERASELFVETVGAIPQRDNYYSISSSEVESCGTVITRRDQWIPTKVVPLQCNFATVESVFRAINYNLPVILTGPSGAGKTDLVRFVGGVVGVPIVEFAMNADVDSMDILGGYEQVDVMRKANRVRETVIAELTEWARHLMAQGKSASSTLALVSALEAKPEVSKMMEVMANYLPEHTTVNLAESYAELQRLAKEMAAVKFEWFDGMLVEAVEKGHWLVLDNANLCNPSVLDRLNSLLEVGGSLVINECAHENGEPRVIVPHPNFRLFLTVNPRYGELSRAMRNRGVELFIDGLEARMTVFDKAMTGSGSVPALKYLDCSNAKIRPFAVLDAAPSLAAVPFASMRDLEAWHQSVKASPMFDGETAGNLVAQANKLTEDGLIDRFFEVASAAWARIVEGDAAAATVVQSIHPLINNYLLYSINQVGGSQLDSRESTVLFTVVKYLLKGQQQLETIAERAMAVKIHELSYIEASAAFELGRDLKKPPRVAIWQMVKSVYAAMVAYYQSLVAHTKPLFETAGFVDLLELQSTWFNLVECAASTNEAKFTVYHELMSDWVKVHPEATEVAQALANYPIAASGARGSSMTLLWEHFRATNYPQSAQGWEYTRELMALCVNFDEVTAVQFSDSAEAVSSLVSVFCQLYSAIIADDSVVPDMMEHARNGLEVLKQVSSKFVIKREATCKAVFAMVARFRTAFGDDADPKLDFFSGRPVADIVLSRNPLWSQVFATKSTEPVRQLFDNDVIVQSIDTAVRYPLTPGYLMEQKRNDTLEIGRQLTTNSQAVLANLVDVMGERLRQWTLQILYAFAETTTDGDAYKALLNDATVSGDFGIVFEAVAMSSDKFFKEVVHSYLAPSLLAGKNWYTLGRSFVMFGAGLLQLFVPQTPYDPAIREYVMWDKLVAYRAQVDAVVAEWRQVSSTLSGDTPTHLEQTLTSLVDTGSMDRPRVFRDPAVPVDQLIDEWNAFMESSVDAEPIAQLLSSIDDEDVHAAAKVEMFQNNSYQFLSRVIAGSSTMEFSDLNQLLGNYIGCLKFGFELLKLSKEVPVTVLANDFPVDVVGLVSKVPAPAALNSVVKKMGADSVAADRLLVFVASMALAGGNDDGFDHAVHTLYQRWSLRRIKEDEQQQSSWFKYTEADDDIEGDFRKLFPDYDESMEGVESVKSTNVSMERVYSQLASVFTNHYVNNQDVTPTQLVEQGAQLVAAIHGVTTTPPPSASTLAATCHLLNHAVNLPEDDSSNFYHGTNAAEFVKSYSVVQKIYFVAKTHLQQWPEHASLQAISRTCWEYMNYSLNQHSLARCLQKVEQIYTYVAEWQKYASSQVSMQPQIEDITTLIVGWRRLELQSWQSLFTHEEAEVEAQVGKWWFYLYETMATVDEDDEGISKLLSALTVFVSQATFGEFASRLKLLEAFSKFKQSMDGDSEISEVLYNFIQFYRQFLAPVSEQIATTRSKLEKDINEVILLASWKDVNIDALKQSSRRSHNSLYKLVRKYRAVLATPVKSVIESGAPASTSSFTGSFSVPHFVESEPGAATTIATWNERKPWLKKLGVVLGNVDVYSSKVFNEEQSSLLEWTEDLVQEMAKLKKETPQTLTDDNKKLVAALRAQKHKLLSDTLKELREMGLKLKVTKQPLTSAQLMCAAPAFEGRLTGVDAPWFQILDLLPKLRFSASKCHEDVPQVEVDKGMAAAEDLLNWLMDGRMALRTFTHGVDQAVAVVKTLSAYAGTELPLPKASVVGSVSANLSAIHNICKQFSSIGDFAYGIIADPVFKPTLVGEEFSGAITGEAADYVTRFTTSWTQVHVDIVKFSEKSSEYGFVGTMVEQWMKLHPLAVWSSTSLTELASVEDVEKQFRQLSALILLVIQKFSQTAMQPPAEDVVSVPWFKDGQKAMKKHLNSLSVGKIASQLRRCVEVVQKVEFDDATSNAVVALLRFTMPLVSAYSKVVAKMFNQATTIYHDNAEASFKLMSTLYQIASNGLCSPQPPQEPEKTDPNLHDGTGLGDGEGAQTNNEDVDANDEDIMDEAQKDNEENGEQNNEDDAVEMEGDMAGKMEDGSDQEDEGSDQEGEDLDEEVDDIDNLDPNEVDEKMWDEEAKEDSKEKESEKMPDAATNDDDMMANEDDTQQEQPKQDDQAPQEGDEEENENDDDAEAEDDVAEQEDDVRNQETDQMDDHVPESEVLDLPEDMNLDGDEDEDGKEEDEPMDFDDDADEGGKEEDKMDENGEDDENLEDENLANEDEPEAGDENDDMDPETKEEEGEDGEEANADPETMEDPMESDVEEVEKKEDDEAGNQQDTAEAAEDGMDADEDGGDEDMDAAAQQQCGEAGEGADAEVNAENDDVGGAGEAQAPQEDNEEQQSEDQARNEAKESMKQLGDALKEFHRRRQEIKEASDEPQQQQANNSKPDDFEHVDGANTNHDTQALGAADSKDQIQSIDEDKAIDDDVLMEPKEEEQDHEIVKKEDEDVEMEDAGTVEDEEAPNDGATSSVVGERKSQDTGDEFQLAESMAIDEDSEDEEVEDMENAVGAVEEPLMTIEEARELWTKSDRATQELASGLCEQLRLILEPTLATKLRGDYKTGKRLNMKRIIPYIASEFRKDKIWLRRTKPSKRQFQIMIAVDDSKSMSESSTTELAFNSIALVSKALTQLESGGLSVVRFGEDVKVVHPFDRPFNNQETGSKIFQWFDFQQTRTDITSLCQKSLTIFDDARATAGNSELWQLQIILSDGVCEDHATVQRLVRKAREHRVMMVFVVMDGISSQESIMDMSQVTYQPDATGSMQLKVDKYLDTFPFEYYVVVKNIKELPEMLALILRQYFSEIAHT